MILFLDIEGAFPNAVCDRLLHNMRKHRVPKLYVKFVQRLLTGRWTKIKFDDFVSQWVDILNRIGQGDPISMILYLFYNADLLEIAKRKKEITLGFIDDAALAALGRTMEETNRKLRRMIIKQHGAYCWSEDHNSSLEMSKFELLHMTQQREGDAMPEIRTTKVKGLAMNLRGVRIEPASMHKFLGVVVNDKLQWNAHAKYALAKATKYAMMFGRLTRLSTGLSPDFMTRLYEAAALPRMVYTAEVWYLPMHWKQEGGPEDQQASQKGWHQYRG